MKHLQFESRIYNRTLKGVQLSSSRFSVLSQTQRYRVLSAEESSLFLFLQAK